MIIKLPFEPVACPRPKITVRSGYPSAYYPPKYKAFKSDVAAYLNRNYPDTRYENCGVHISYTFVIKRPKSLYRNCDYSFRIKHTKKPDLDNFIKSVNDVLEDAGILSNDSIVYSISASKWIADKEEEPHIIVEISND